MDLDRYPFPSQRMPLMAENGVVATSQALAAQSGLHMLRQGGNAVDAALATAAALTVLEPTANGIGGDAFALIWDGALWHGLNGSGRAPAALEARALRDRGFSAVPALGWWPVTVPGLPSAWQALHERFARLPWEVLLGPAIDYAENGFAVSPAVARDWAAAAKRFLEPADPQFAPWAETFTRGGCAPRTGERWCAPNHARTLKRFVQCGLGDFYDGELAERIAAYSQAAGGLLCAEDLTAHYSEWVQPVAIRYRDYVVFELPPNGQGLAALLALALLDGFDVSQQAHGSECVVHCQLEAMKLAFDDAYRAVADPQVSDVPVAALLDPSYVAGRRALICEHARTPLAGSPGGADTVYLCSADRDGMMVSYIQSNYQGFGSGLVVPDTGIALHNRGMGFSLEPGHPNEAAGAKRPFHTIIPAFLARDGSPVAAFGVMGAAMQPQGHTQIVSGMLDHALNPQAALDAPRWRLGDRFEVYLEPLLGQAIGIQLAARGHEVHSAEGSQGFGRGQIIWRMANGIYLAGSDPRADGAAVGW
jgi:gamma-glutamyltranspeptidase/glutathione hydrolase